MHRILIVESEPLIADFLEKGLQARRFVTAVTETLPQPAAACEFDVVVVDDRLIDEQAVAMLEHLGGLDDRPALIVLTGNGRVSATFAALGDLSGHVVTKPFRFADLLELIEQHVARPDGEPAEGG
jgi:DNA-binding response OmpR family regulator